MDLTFVGVGSAGESITVPVTQAVVDGTFNTDERCGIGLQETTTPPTSWITAGTLRGLLTVEDARAVSFTFSGIEITLCAAVAYGIADIIGLLGDPSCLAAETEWTNTPDATTADGAEAWTVEAEYAATAIYLVE
jgi:hypothetical protein